MMQMPWLENLGIVVLVYSDMILRTFAARFEAALGSRILSGLGYPEKPEKILSFCHHL